MRSIGASSTQVYEGLCIALVNWWVEKKSPYTRVLEWLSAQEPDVFVTKNEFTIGLKILENIPFHKEFFRDLENDGCASSIFRTATSIRAESNFRERIVTELAERFGVVVKDSGWFDKNRLAIERTKRQTKVVKSVMES